MSSGDGRYLSSLNSAWYTSMMAKQVSKPMRSARANGPIGWLQPSFMPVSISSGLATPSCKTKNASLIMGRRMRFTTKPGELWTVMGSLPILVAIARTALRVSGLVCLPIMTSSKAMSGGGLKKWIPIKRSGLELREPRCVMEIDEVLLAIMVSLLTTWSTCAKIFSLMAWFSVAASITNETEARSV